MCQRASGNVWLALKEVKVADVRWDGEPARYRSSPIARRGFCATCGTSLTWESDDGENMDLTVARASTIPGTSVRRGRAGSRAGTRRGALARAARRPHGGQCEHRREMEGCPTRCPD
ncbi:GFA family protein [Sphingomonas sp. MMS24-JH45]